MTYQRMHSLTCFRLVCHLGSLQEQDAQCMKLRREMRHHLPALQQNHHHRVNNNERFASRIYHSPNSFQSDPRKPPGSAVEPTGFDNHGFDRVGFSSSCGKAPQPKALRQQGCRHEGWRPSIRRQSGCSAPNKSRPHRTSGMQQV
jgi:hypothetical protein